MVMDQSKERKWDNLVLGKGSGLAHLEIKSRWGPDFAR